jgi:hypothetical protein
VGEAEKEKKRGRETYLRAHGDLRLIMRLARKRPTGPLESLEHVNFSVKKHEKIKMTELVTKHG